MKIKVKANKSAKKRLKKTSKFYVRKSAFRSHLLRKKSSNSLRRLYKLKSISSPDWCLLKNLIVYL